MRWPQVDKALKPAGLQNIGEKAHMSLHRVEGSLEEVASETCAIDDPAKILADKILLGSGRRDNPLAPGA